MRKLVAFALVTLAFTGPARAEAAAAARSSESPRTGPAVASAKIAPALARRAADSPEVPVAMWVYFTDRAGRDHDPAAYAEARRALTARAMIRRARRGVRQDLVASDLPVHESYVRALVARGATVRGLSRWLNAASVSIAAGQALELARLPFVARLELVPVWPRRGDDPGHVTPEPAPIGDRGLESARPGNVVAAPGDTAYYGGTFKQLSMMQVPQLHQQGLSGAGVLVCMTDEGFRTTHEAFAGLNVVARRDFIHHDTNVDTDSTQDVPGQGSHGTMTLSCVAGSKPGTFSGGAFGASVALAKTEDDASETPVEMDYWQFAAEWADSLGADVISSSLGYLGFDTPWPSYSQADLDGHTTVVTLAALEAARRGIVVVNAAGNGGPNPSTLIAPADADSIVTVGAVDSLGVVASFSSRGPTADGRIKPDVMAMGRSVLLASYSNPTAYVRANGTSFATPLTAGAIALLLEAHPFWRPFEVIEALHGTSTNHLAPNNTYGWGQIQTLAANGWVPSTTQADGPVVTHELSLAAAPNPARAGQGVAVRFTAPVGARVTLDVLDVSGRRRARLFEGAAAGPRMVSWNGTGDGDRPLAAGVYWVALSSHAPGAGSPTTRAIRVALVP